jgi:GTP-binding protein
MKRPQIVVANKMDIEGAKDNLVKFKEEYPDLIVFETSAITHTGLDPMLLEVSNLLESTPYFDMFDEQQYESNVLYKFEVEEPFTVTKCDDGSYELGGDRLIKLFKMTNFDHEDAAQRFARKLKEMGIDDALREKGCKNGDVVKILEHEFEFLD